MFRSTILALHLGLLPVLLSGCMGGAVGAALGMFQLAEDDESHSDALPSVVFQTPIAPPEGFSHERIRAEITIVNEDAGTLDAELWFAAPAGSATRWPASLLAKESLDSPDRPSAPQRQSRSIAFTWDAKSDLETHRGLWRDSEEVELVVIPTEDGWRGGEWRSPPFRAGSYPVEVEGVDFKQPVDNPSLLIVSFRLVDKEGDAVPTRDGRLQLDIAASELREGEEVDGVTELNFHRVPLELVSAPASFPSTAGNAGELSLDVTLLNARPDLPADLRLLGEPGFRGAVAVRLSVRDSATHDFDTEASPVKIFSTNEPPLVELLPIRPGQLESGVVAVRYRLFDAQRNPARVDVQFRPPGGEFQLANEFPGALSAGRGAQATGDPADFGNPAAPFATFLWDALSQSPGSTAGDLRVSAADRERRPGGPTQALADVAFPGLAHREDFRAGARPIAVAGADFNGDGWRDLVVANQLSNELTYLSGGGEGLARERTHPLAEQPTALTTGDYNADGRPDLLVATNRSFCSEDDVVFYMPGAPGGLSAPEPIDVGRCVKAVTSADFDGDGVTDVAVANLFSKSVTYLRGLRARGLVAERTLQLDEDPVALAAGHFRAGQGAARDLVVATLVNEQLDGHVLYLPGGAGGLDETRSRKLKFDGVPRALATADFNGDGHLDAVVAALEEWVTFLPGSPDGLLTVPAVRAPVTGRGPLAVASGDFNGEGRPELVLANVHSRNLTCISGDGEWPDREREITVVGLTTELAVRQVLATGDFDGDGFVDLVVPDIDLGVVTLLRGGRSGLAREPGRFAEIPTGKPLAVESGDFDGDGLIDLVAANDGARVVDSGRLSFLEGVASGLKTVERVGAGSFPIALVTGDFDRDSDLDAVVANNEKNVRDLWTLTLLRASVDGLTSEEIELPAATQATGFGGPCGLARADFNRDGWLDVLVTLRAENKVALVTGTPDGLRWAADTPVGDTPCEVLAGDFDGDTFPDAVVANQRASKSLRYTLSFLQGSDTGLLPSTEIDVGAARDRSAIGPCALASADFDGDGAPDVVVANDALDEAVYLRGGGGGLTVERRLAVGSSPCALATGDFDADGFVDLVVANTGSGSLSQLLGGPGGPGGDGGPAVEIPDVGQRPLDVIAGDFDGDGFHDVVVALQTPDDDNQFYAVYIRGSVDGLPTEPALYQKVVLEAAPGSPQSGPSVLRASDLNGDGFLDVAVANGWTGNVTCLVGGPTGLRSGARFAAGAPPLALAIGDTNGDSFPDLLVAAANSNDVVHFRQRFSTRHPNTLVDPAASPARQIELVDPRNPARYSLVVASDQFASLTQVCMVPGPVFDLPPARAVNPVGGGAPRVAAAPGRRYRVAITDPVSILRATTQIEKGEAILSLRLRDHDPELLKDALSGRGRWVIVRQDNDTGVGVEEEIDPERIESADFFGAKAIVFPITRFGTYVVALELER